MMLRINYKELNKNLVKMNIPGSRERALTLTKLEEAHFWLVATQAE